MNPYRRYLTFSLRTLFVLMTALAVWLGVIVNRAREQQEAVKAIEAMGGLVAYEWQLPTLGSTNHRILVASPTEPGGSAWLRDLLGDDYFQQAVAVVLIRERAAGFTLNASSIGRFFPYFRQLRSLKRADVCGEETDSIAAELRAALPECEVYSFNDDL